LPQTAKESNVEPVRALRVREFFVAASSSSSLIRRAAVAAFAVALCCCAAAQAQTAPKPDRTVDMATVLQPGPLQELSIGDANGVPVVEYGSLTCPHCAVFDHDVLPAFKSAYVDTGKARFIFREFSRNALDAAGFVLARCVGDDKALATIGLLFAEQEKWAFVDHPFDALVAAMRPTGMSRDKAMECLKDQAKADAMRKIVETAVSTVKVTGTPTFVIDGKVYDGELSLSELDAILKPLVK
jgi:protein-disulfide isomerase